MVQTSLKPLAAIVVAKLVVAPFLGLCVDGLLKDSGAIIMAAAQEPFNPAFGGHSRCGLSICVFCVDDVRWAGYPGSWLRILL